MDGHRVNGPVRDQHNGGVDMGQRIRGDNTRRFWSKVEVADSCWLWTDPLDRDGYARFYWNGRTMGAHRVAYEQFIGPISDGLVIDHLCRVRHCVNPEHMEVVTNRENLRRGESFSAKKKRQTECIHGHPFTSENTYIRPDNGCRQCRECNRIVAN